MTFKIFIMSDVETYSFLILLRDDSRGNSRMMAMQRNLAIIKRVE